MIKLFNRRGNMFYFACVLGTQVLFGCNSQKISQLEIPADINSFEDKVDSIVISKMIEYNTPGISVGIVNEGKIRYSKGYGIADIETKQSITDRSVFHTASVSKLFTAQAVMEVLLDKEISVDSRLMEVIPDLKSQDKRLEAVTIKQVLNHTAGFDDINNYHWDNNNQSDKALRAFIMDQKFSLISDPGLEFNYSNLGYDILGLVVENLSGNSFEDYVNSRILKPSGMNQSDFRYFQIQDKLKVSPHTKSRITGKVSRRDTYPYTREHAPSSTLNANVIDLGNWMISFMNALESDSSYFKQMTTASHDQFQFIGLGFQMGEIAGHQKIGHYGGDKGFRSYLFMIPSKKMGFVVLGNCDYNEDFRQEILHPIAELMLQ